MIKSLRVRLFAGAAIWILVALVVAGAAIAAMFNANVEQTVRAGLSASLNRVIAVVDPSQEQPQLRDELPDPRYDIPQSGAYWQVAAQGGPAMLRSRSLWDHVLAEVPTAEEGEVFRVLSGPGNQSLSTLSRQVRYQTATGPRTYTVTVAEDRQVIQEAVDRFGWSLALALAMLGAALGAAALLQVGLGLRPLQTLREGLEAVRRGRADRLPSDYPQEVAPLVHEVNELLEVQDRAMEHARKRASDLAHGLKTPLSALQGIAADLRQSGNSVAADAVGQTVAEMTERVDYQLRLAGLRLRSKSQPMEASVREAILRSMKVLRHAPRGQELLWGVDLDEGLSVDMEPRDLMELAGVLLENAVKWARSQISVTATSEGDWVRIIITDDGPGLSEDQRARVGQRGQRLDQSQPGTGLGLSIAGEIVALNAGQMVLGPAEAGGLAVTLRLPKAAPEEARAS